MMIMMMISKLNVSDHGTEKKINPQAQRLELDHNIRKPQPHRRIHIDRREACETLCMWQICSVVLASNKGRE